MVSFFQTTWLLWWALAITAIVRWFQVVSANRAWDHEAEPGFDDPESTAVSPALSSSWSSGAQA
jgi:hypothetical protein